MPSPLSFTWDLYDNQNQISNVGDLIRPIQLLRGTARVHAQLLADPTNPPAGHYGSPKNLMNKVNSIDPVARLNWMKMSFGRRTTHGPVDVVIVYHLLKHRKMASASKVRQWSITVGFDATLVAGQMPGGDPDDPDNAYVQLATEINKAIKIDIARTNRFDPAVKSLVWIDDSRVPDASSPPKYVIESEQQRRAKPIGELGYIAENNTAIRADWPTWSGAQLDIPKDSYGKDIPGYGRAGNKVLVTEVTAK